MSSSSIMNLMSLNGGAAGSPSWLSRRASPHLLGGYGSSRIRLISRIPSSIRISRKEEDLGSSFYWLSRKNSSAGSCGVGIDTMSVSDDNTIVCPPPPPREISPWLVLPPEVFEGGDVLYKFYSLAENKVVSVKNSGGGDEEKIELPDCDAFTMFKGSSHGWLVLYNERKCELFLSNPLSSRHIKLPPVHTLAIPEVSLEGGYNCLHNVIISCSPDQQDCRAMMTFGPQERLAFCWPGHSLEWTPIGTVYGKPDLWGEQFVRSYQSFVYSTKQNLFFCISKYDEFEAWDLSDHRSPRRIPMDDVTVDEGKLFVEEPVAETTTSSFLVIAEHSDQLFLVRRFRRDRMGPDGSYVPEVYDSDNGYDDSVPYKTVGFDVHKYDPENRSFKYMYMDSCSLDGLALFVGRNHGFALRANDFPELKPDSIYFTDPLTLPTRNTTFENDYGGHDNGIFNYQDGTFSPCYYPLDYESIQRIAPVPMWFTPSIPF